MISQWSLIGYLGQARGRRDKRATLIYAIILMETDQDGR